MTPEQQRRVEEAQRVLHAFNFDAERANERSALVLLALLNLTPGKRWSESSNPMLRTVEIMDWLRVQYGKDYKPNTRETIRRQTLHQFVDAALVTLNPDEPRRPINSPRNCYQVQPAALDVLRMYGLGDWDGQLTAYLDDVPGLRAQYESARTLELIPVTLADGRAVTLTPGGQNVLMKQMVEDFCARWTPGGYVLYIGDAGKDDPVYDKAKLSELGVELDKHGKFPDLIVYLPDRNWLVLLEAASSHGPVDAKRHSELHDLFGGSTAGLVYVSCFPSRSEMRKYLAEIALGN